MKRLSLSSVLLLLVLFFFAQDSFAFPKKGKSPDDLEYVGEKSCKSCHAKEVKEWTNSHHDKAMQLATAKTVRGNFKNSVFDHKGVKTRFFKKGKKFMVNTEGPDGKNQDFEIFYTFGHYPLQQYLIAFPQGEVKALHIGWDLLKKKWFHLQPELDIDHAEWLHWSRGGQKWNNLCADCHSTYLKKGYDSKKEAYQTTWTSINVSCEACHGPGKKHVEAAKAGKPAKALLLGMKKGDTNVHQVDGCARCHSRRSQITEVFDHKGVFMDHYVPEVLRSDLYHPDGQILDEVYVYGSFLQSKMYSKGVSCSDCHNPHTTKLKAKGNKLCVTCHEAPVFNTKKHHFHPPKSKGAQCIECHMPGKLYMVNDLRRDHSFRVPRPDLSITFGTPDACTTCHDDKKSKWAASTIEKWYGKKRKRHFSDTLVVGFTQPNRAVPELIELLKNKEEPSIARATATWLLSTTGDRSAFDATVLALKDEDPLTRNTAVNSLLFMPPESRLPLLSPLLQDPVRAVRSSAANALADIDEKKIDAADLPHFKKALEEYKTSLEMSADFAAGQQIMASHYERTGKDDLAIQAYLRSIEIDPLYNASRINLANLFHRKGEKKKAERLFKKVIKLEPEFGQTYYSLGLLLAGDNRMKEAVEYLGIAAVKIENNPRVYYNWGLALQKTNQIAKAEQAFIGALKIDPNDLSNLNALVILNVQRAHYKKALGYAKQMAKIRPMDQQLQKLVRDLGPAARQSTN